MNESELTKAIIGTIGDFDAYQLPDAKGYTSMMRYLTGRTDEMRQKERDEVLSTNGEDFIAFGEVLGESSPNPRQLWRLGHSPRLRARRLD